MNNHRHSKSAILFSSSLIHHIEGHPSLRLPSTYIGVRRVRPKILKDDSGSSRGGEEEDMHSSGNLKRKRSEEGGDDEASSCEPADAIGSDNERSADDGPPSNNINQNEVISYMITNPDGSQRRMTKQEKKKLKYEIKQSRHLVRKEERQRQHLQRIREDKAGKRKRRKVKWEKKQRERRLREQGEEDGDGGRREHEEGAHPSTDKECKGTESTPIGSVATKNKEAQKAEENGDSYSAKSSVSSAGEVEGFDEELAAIKGGRRGIPPVMLTPAATSVAQDMGVLLLPGESKGRQHNRHNGSISTAIIMDAKLSAQWAEQLQRSMAPAETARAKEDMRPMAYRLVPEVWKRLCPESIWKEVSNDGGAATNKLQGKAEESKVKVSKEASEPTEPTKEDAQYANTAPQTTITQGGHHFFALLRNPSPPYDEDAYLILKHLHQHSNLHVTCGALFGCDFLLYDGRREERHSFAGLRVYSCSRRGNFSNDTSQQQQQSGQEDNIGFPIPTAYDMAGFVRTMNTARKIALIATVVREGVGAGDEGEGNVCVARIVIVDLALEKVLEAPTHIRKGNVTKRRSEEDAASCLARTK